jgi:predicted MPP superfamily phosphohydrolase
MSLFFTIVVSVFLTIVALQYMLIRVMLPQRLSRVAKIIISGLLSISINTILFFYMISERILDQLPWWHRELILFPYAILMVASAFSGGLFVIVFLARSILPKRWPKFDTSKRDFMANTARSLTATSVGLLAYGAYYENKTPEVSRLALQYKGLHPDLSGFRLVHITDIHAGPLISFETIAEVVSKANYLKPDLIVLTGDYVNHNPAYIHGCLKLLDELSAPAGVFGVYGNHDYYTGIDAMRDGFSRTHISMLSDSHLAPKGLEGLLNITGVEDPVSGWATDAQFRNLGEISKLVVPDQFNLLLSHRPGIFSVCDDWNVQLTLAGHTHGGQVIVPGMGERGFSLAGFFVTFTHGLYESQKDREARMYVSRGIGTIVAPVRLFCKPELVEITLTRA